jgi:hypothetical protein
VIATRITTVPEVSIVGKGDAAVQKVDQQYDLALLTVPGSNVLASRSAFHLDRTRRWVGEHLWPFAATAISRSSRWT